MAGGLELINKAIEEHHTIRSHIKLTGESVNDIDALFKLQKAQADWALISIEHLTEMKEKLLQTLSHLNEGLQNHFRFEEQYLAPFFGKYVFSALEIDHAEIVGEIEKAKLAIMGIAEKELKREELLSKKAYLQNAINVLAQLIQEHAHKEETILQMVKKALEKTN